MGMTAAQVQKLGQRWQEPGFAVFPIAISLKDSATGKTNKRPLTSAGFKDATTDPVMLASQLNAGVPKLKPNETLGLGLVPGSGGHIIFDLDILGGKGDGVTYGHEILGLPASYTIKTASGGQHVWYRKRDDIAISNASPWDQYNIEIRADNGFVVAPGVRSPWGDWAEISDFVSVVEVPSALWEQLVPATETDTATDSDTSGPLDGLAAELLRDGDKARKHSTHDSNLAFKLAGEFQAKGVGCAAAFDLMLDHRNKGGDKIQRIAKEKGQSVAKADWARKWAAAAKLLTERIGTRADAHARIERVRQDRSYTKDLPPSAATRCKKILDAYCDRGDELGTIKVSISERTLAEITGMSQKTINKYRHQLRAAGRLKLTNPEQHDSHTQAPVFEIREPEPVGVSKVLTYIVLSTAN